MLLKPTRMDACTLLTGARIRSLQVELDRLSDSQVVLKRQLRENAYRMQFLSQQLAYAKSQQAELAYLRCL